VKLNNWYDFAVAPLTETARVCEMIEARGWEVVNVFNTGAVGKVVTSAIVKPGEPDQITPLMAILARRPGRKNNGVRPALSEVPKIDKITAIPRPEAPAAPAAAAEDKAGKTLKFPNAAKEPDKSA
jgi:hypothetical protein